MTAVGKVMIKAGGHAASTEFLSTCSEGIQVVYYLDPFSDSNLPAPTGPDHSLTMAQVTLDTIAAAGVVGRANCGHVKLAGKADPCSLLKADALFRVAADAAP